jgi:hypothetical protein
MLIIIAFPICGFHFYVMLHAYGIIVGVVAGCGSMRAFFEDDIPLAVSTKE